MENRIIAREMIYATVLWWKNQLINLPTEEDPNHPVDKEGRRAGENFFSTFVRAINTKDDSPVDKKLKKFIIILEKKLYEMSKRTSRIVLRTEHLPILLLFDVCKEADCLGMSFPHDAWTHLDFKTGTVTWGEFKKGGGTIFPTEKQVA